MKILILAAALGITLGQGHGAWRYEFEADYPNASGAGGYIDLVSQVGTEVDILSAIAALSFSGVGLETIPATTFTEQDDLSYFGTMSWDGEKLSGFWLINSPVQRDANEGFLSRYYAEAGGIASFWPLQYFPNESFLSGTWRFSHQVPESGTTFGYLLLGIGLVGFFRRIALA